MSSCPTQPEPAIDAAIVRRAAEWMARLWSGEASGEERAACERWRAEHPDHERAWSRLQLFEQKLGGVPRDVARHALREPAAKAPRTRRRAIRLLGLTLASGSLAYVLRDTGTWQAASADAATGTGEIRDLTLPDGSRVVLASASAIDVRFDAGERLIILRQGEILVDTAPDPAAVHRPLRVRGRHGSVQALGTRFSVRQDEDRTRVAVFEGAVEIRPAQAPGTATRIEAGQATAFDHLGALPPAAVRDTAAAWTGGVLVADGLRVGDLVAELARYRRGLLRCDPAVAELKVTGVFPLRDTDRALHNLALALPVAVVFRTRWWVTVEPA